MAQRRNRDYTSTLPRPLPAEVKRTALLKRIVNADNTGLVILVAPSGYGKTTLLGQVARASKYAAWLTLSDRHADLKSLTDALMASVTRAVKEATFGRVRKAVAEGAQASALATLFARELDELPVNIKMLVDQTHLLGDDALAWLESFALALGEGHQLIYCAYDLASERLAAPLASGSALLLTTSDLAFSEDESRAYLSARGSSADALEVHRELEGWPAGVGLAAAGLGHVLSHEELLRAAFDRLPEDVRKALPEASVLEVWREADATQLGCDLPKGWLREARRAGLPMTPLSAQAYRPHTLVSETLEREFQVQVERHRELHTRAGHKAQRENNLLPALKSFGKANDMEKALETAEVLIPQLRSNHEYKLSHQLLTSFRSEDLSPKLYAELGYALLFLGNANYAEKIFQNLKAQNTGGTLVFFGLCDLARRHGKASQHLALAEEGLARAESEYEWELMQRTKVHALMGSGRFDEALTLSHEIVQHMEHKGNRRHLAVALYDLCLVYQRTGEDTLCEATIQQALGIYLESTEHKDHLVLGLTNNLAKLYRRQGRLQKAFDLLNQILPIAEQTPGLIRLLVIETLADVFMSIESFEEASTYYDRLISQSHALGAAVLAQRSRYRLSDALRLRGNAELGHKTLAEARRDWDSEDADLRGFRTFYEALNAFARGDKRVATEGFNKTISSLTNIELDIRAHIYLLEIARRDKALHKTQVVAFVEKLDDFGYDSILRIDAKPLKILYEEFIARDWYAERFTPFTKPHPVLETPQRFRSALSIQSLADIHLSFDGKPVKPPFAKVTELLVWLAFHGPSSREEIIDALWNGSSDPRHVEYGKLALRRLRTALAEHVPFNPLVYAERQYRLADELEVKLDVQDVSKAFEEGDDTARRRALERYDGTFLPGFTSEWVEALRTELHDAALATAMGLGASYEHNDLPFALWAYRKVVELEPLYLDGYRALVRLLQASGDQVGARLTYQTYLRVLTTEYGETPDFTFDDLLYKTQVKRLN